MNVLFLSIGKLDNIEDRGIYTDLLRQFRDNGHMVYVASPRERRTNLPTEYTIAQDADERVVGSFKKLCKERGITIEYVDTMKELGKACNIDVGSAIAVILK